MNSTQIHNQDSYFRKIRQVLVSKKAKGIFLDVIVYLFVLLFVYTAASKLMEIDNFKRVLIHYPLIGSWNKELAYLVPAIELTVSLLLIVPITRKIGLWCAFVLMVSFLGYIIYMLVSASELPCSCGGVISKLSWQQHVWFNSIFVLLSFMGIRLSRK